MCGFISGDQWLAIEQCNPQHGLSACDSWGYGQLVVRGPCSGAMTLVFSSQCGGAGSFLLSWHYKNAVTVKPPYWLSLAILRGHPAFPSTSTWLYSNASDQKL